MSGRGKLALKDRVWEVDALRGLLILCVLATHLYYTVDAFCINGYYKIDSYAFVNLTDPLHFWFDWGEDGVIYRAFLSDKLRETWVRLGVDGFFVLSGLSCIFSRNHWKSCVRLLCAAVFLGLFTKLLAVLTGDEGQFIRFGVLHCYAACHLIHYFLLEGRSDKVLLLTALAAFLIGYPLRYGSVYSELSLLVPFGIRERGASPIFTL